MVNVVAVYTTGCFEGELKADKEEAYEVRFFELKELPLELSPPDKPVIERFLCSLNAG